MSTRTYGISNRTMSQVEPLLTVERLKNTYLFGSNNIVDSEGNTLSDEALQTYLDAARSLLEHYLDLSLVPRQVEEERDYISSNYFQWGYMNLLHYPVISVEEMFASFLRDEDGAYDLNNIIQIPASWRRLKKETGILRFVPTNKFPAKLMLNQNGNFFPELFLRHSRIPDLWVIRYTWGLKEGEVPALINHAIGMLAAIFILSPLGNLALGNPGVSGSSLSLDGLSQSVSTTLSSEAGGSFAAQLKDYKSQLWGSTPNDQTAYLNIIKNYYKGVNINFI